MKLLEGAVSNKSLFGSKMGFNCGADNATPGTENLSSTHRQHTSIHYKLSCTEVLANDARAYCRCFLYVTSETITRTCYLRPAYDNFLLLS